MSILLVVVSNSGGGIMRTALALAVVAVLFVGIVAWYWRKSRRLLAQDLAELDKVIWDVIARLSHGRQSLNKEILKGNFTQTVDGREQKMVWIDTIEFNLFVSKETKRPRVWVKLKRGENTIEIICRNTSKLGKAADSLFSSIKEYSGKPKSTSEVGNGQV